MQVQIEREIYIRASRCYELLSQARQTFKDYLEDRIPPNDPMYYRARHFLKEGKAFFDQTVADAKKLLGPIPIYAAGDFSEWRARVLEENKIVVHGETPESLKDELANDDFIKSMMPADEVAAYVADRFETQRTGKRKLSHMKIRLIIDRLAGLLLEDQEILKTAQRKQQGLPI
jgi:hypothetical protein